MTCTAVKANVYVMFSLMNTRGKEDYDWRWNWYDSHRPKTEVCSNSMFRFKKRYEWDTE